jgi:hypothetical protein
MRMTRKIRFASFAYATAALLIILPLAWAPMNSRVGGTAVVSAAKPEDQATSQRAQNAARFAASSAYRDGLYQGQLAASRNVASRIPVGRWSSQADKEAFAIGYQDGYAQALAEKRPPVPAQ